MKRGYLWGAGYYADFIYSVIDKTFCVVKGIVDSDSEKQGKEWKQGLSISAPEVLKEESFDYIFVSPRKYEGIIKQCLDMGIPEEKIIVYWRDKEAEGLYHNRAVRAAESDKECAKYKNRLLNAPYEWGLKEIPRIKPATELLLRIIAEKCSLCRYGDGEFEIMLHRERAWFQKVDNELAERMREIILSKREDVIIAVADNFGNLDKYKEDVADDIREYMVQSREDIILLLNQDDNYYDAYVSRPYIIYRDKEYATEIFRLLKKVWQDREVLLIEGRTARIGLGNDLFQGAKGISRIECPEKNAWDIYQNILQAIKEIAKQDTLICISLGSTATVLAYDLAIAGYQALDIGQLDNEYEWYIRGVDERIPILGKMVAEVDRGICANDRTQMDENHETEYRKQVVAELNM